MLNKMIDRNINIDREEFDIPQFNNIVIIGGSGKKIIHTTPTGSVARTVTPTSIVQSEIEKKLDEKYDLYLIFFNDQINALKGKNKESNKRIQSLTEELFRINKELNLNKIDKISSLKNNWAGDEVMPIDKKVISIARDLIFSKIDVQPQVFPTRNGTILFEYQAGDLKFLAIEILSNNFSVYWETKEEEKEFETTDYKIILPYINEFRER